jgi:hypothetical protein
MPVRATPTTDERPPPRSPGLRRPSPSAPSPTAGERHPGLSALCPTPSPSATSPMAGDRRPGHPPSVRRHARQEPRPRPASAHARQEPRPQQASAIRLDRHALAPQKFICERSRLPARPPPPDRDLRQAPRCHYTYPRKTRHSLTFQASHSPIANIRNVFIKVLIDYSLNPQV